MHCVELLFALLTQTSAYLKTATMDLWMAWQTCSTVEPPLMMMGSLKSGEDPGFLV